jgi:2-oxoglutarate dehydrogenase E2 component (dihydrolipoamide succinyltransferase)
MDVVMPQMGESIAQGTISSWTKSVGESVERDETLFEISTDKVDADIPSPASGVLTEILVEEGATVDVGTVVARLDIGDGAAVAGSSESVAPSPAVEEGSDSAPDTPVAEVKAAALSSARLAVSVQAIAGELFPASAKGIDSVEELRRLRSTPVVRAIASEHGIPLREVPGTGIQGRVTKKDILAYLETRGSQANTESLPIQAAPTVPAAPEALSSGLWAFNPSLNPLGPSPYPTHGPNEVVEIEPMSTMRKGIARHMVASQNFSAHVEQMIEVDFTAIDQVRGRLRGKYAKRGIKLTYTPFILQAVARALREFPQFNVSVDGENLIKKPDVNLGLAVALEWGLIVPVIRRADELSLSGMARASNDLAERARTRKLAPGDVQGGTFTVTNPGSLGVLCGNPIINQPQVAILGCGVIEKRVVAVNDAIAIRKRSYFTLTIDHRVLDGADGAYFLKFLKDYLEAGDFGEI